MRLFFNSQLVYVLKKKLSLNCESNYNISLKFNAENNFFFYLILHKVIKMNKNKLNKRYYYNLIYF